MAAFCLDLTAPPGVSRHRANSAPADPRRSHVLGKQTTQLQRTALTLSASGPGCLCITAFLWYPGFISEFVLPLRHWHCVAIGARTSTRPCLMVTCWAEKTRPCSQQRAAGLHLWTPKLPILVVLWAPPRGAGPICIYGMNHCPLGTNLPENLP